jgi:hypothetical protein
MLRYAPLHLHGVMKIQALRAYSMENGELKMENEGFRRQRPSPFTLHPSPLFSPFLFPPKRTEFQKFLFIFS